MKLTSKGRYAVMAMADIANNNVKKPTSLSEISLRQGISLSFLEQLFLRLKKNNLVQSSRGPNGGYVLSRAPEEIKLLNIMKLTSKGRYAVMAMADLAKNNVKEPTSLAEISLRQGISISYLEQLFIKLRKNNLVQSARGPSGGYVLSKPPDEIKLLSIIRAVDEKIKTVKCKKESKKGCNGKSIKCITHNLWDDLAIHINKFFEDNTLNDVLFRGVKNNSEEIKQ